MSDDKDMNAPPTTQGVPVTTLHPARENLCATIPMLVPGTDEHRRQPRVSASVAAALFNCHPFTDVHRLAALRRGETADEAGEAASTGTLLEDRVAQWWGDEHGAALVKPTVTYVRGPLSANPDRLIVGSTTDIVQVKCTSKTEGGMAPYWWYQGQAELACTGAERDHFAVLWGGSLTLRSYIVSRDEDAIANLLDRAEAFCAHLEMGLDPPQPDGVDPDEVTVTLGTGEVDMFRQLASLNEAKTYAEKEAKPLKAQLAALLGAPGMVAGSRLTAVDADGKPVGKMRVQRGREKTTGTGSFGDDFAVIETL